MSRAALAGVLVAAAISLKAPLEEAAAAFGAASAGEPIVFHFAASGQLVAQIEGGAPVSVFVSASPVEMERLATAGRIDTATRTAIAGNRLVVIVRNGLDPPTTPADLTRDRFARVAVGNPKTVPVGRYGRQALEALGLLDAIAPRLVFAENARQILDLMDRAEADAALVYATDAAAKGRWTYACEIPATAHAPIAYEAAVIAGAPGASRGAAFIRHLASPPGQATLAKHGFAVRE